MPKDQVRNQKPQPFYRECLALFDDAKALFEDMMRLTCECRALADQAQDAADLAEEIVYITKSDKSPVFFAGSDELKVYCTRSARFLRWRTWVKKHCPDYIPAEW